MVPVKIVRGFGYRRLPRDRSASLIIVAATLAIVTGFLILVSAGVRP